MNENNNQTPTEEPAPVIEKVSLSDIREIQQEENEEKLADFYKNMITDFLALSKEDRQKVISVIKDNTNKKE